jgi:hypothetical protein
MSSYREYRVHPNSMAARKWNRTTWRSSSNLYALAHEAHVNGDAQRAVALRRAAARAAITEISCR